MSGLVWKQSSVHEQVQHCESHAKIFIDKCTVLFAGMLLCLAPALTWTSTCCGILDLGLRGMCPDTPCPRTQTASQIGLRSCGITLDKQPIQKSAAQGNPSGVAP
jgi:hypothetical protein